MIQTVLPGAYAPPVEVTPRRGRPPRSAPLYPRLGPFYRDGELHGGRYQVECPDCDATGYAVLYTPQDPAGAPNTIETPRGRTFKLWRCERPVPGGLGPYPAGIFICGATWLGEEWLFSVGKGQCHRAPEPDPILSVDP